MSIDWLNPATQVAILAGVLGVGLLGSMTLWIAVKIDVRAGKKAFDAFRESSEATIQELRGSVEALKAVPVADLAPTMQNVMAVQGLNLTNRTKALRMHRRGESVGSIAAALGVAQEEIELLLKLERLLEVPAA